MSGSFVKGVVLGAVVSVLTMGAASAVAGTGVGDVFNLGTTNTVDAINVLTGSVGGNSELRVDNTSTAASSFGILSRVTPAAPGVNSAGVRGVIVGTGAEGFGVVGIHNGTGVGVLGQSSGVAV